MTAYTSSLNVFPALAGGTGSKGQAVCNPGSGFVVATTANRAGGTIDIEGVALEDFFPGQTFRICSSGHVPSDVVGALGGVGVFVNATASGGLTRAAAVNADTIGRYLSSGAVDVSLSLNTGGAFSGNATQIQGVAVDNSLTSISAIHAGNGQSIHARAAVEINFMDVKHPSLGTYPDPTGATDNYPHLIYALSLIGRAKQYRGLYIPAGTYLISIPATDRPPGLYDDDSTGFQQGCWIRGDSSDRAPSGSILNFRVTSKTTTTGTYVSRASGSPTQASWRMGGWSGLAEIDRHRIALVYGEGCRNAGWWRVAKISGTDTISLQSDYYDATGGGAADTDLQDDSALSGSIYGELFTYCLAQHALNSTITGLAFMTSGTARPYSILDRRNPEGPGKTVNFRFYSSHLYYVGSASQACMPFYGESTALMPSSLSVSQTFTVANLTTDVLQCSDWQISTGSPCKVSSTGTLPAPLVAGTTYFARVNITNAVTLHTTQAGALAGTGRVDITTNGTGVHTIAAYNYYFAETGEDGTDTDVPLVGVNYGNCDVSVTSFCRYAIFAGWLGGVVHGNANGQSIQNLYHQCLFEHSQGHQYVQPKRLEARAQVHFNECSWSMGDGFAIEIWDATRECTLTGNYSEAWGGLIYVGGAMPVQISGQHCRGGAANALCTQVYQGNGGPITITGGLWGQYDTGPNAYNAGSFDSPCSTVFAQGSADLPGKVSITGVEQLGEAKIATLGTPARRYGVHARGVYNIPAGGEMWIEVAGTDHALMAMGSPFQGIACTKVWKFVAAGSVWTDVTTAMGNTTAADVTFGGAVGDIMYFGFDQRYCALVANYAGGTAGIGGTMVWEYLNASGSWISLSGVGDDTVGFTHAVANDLMIDWSMPTHAAAASAWAKGTVNGTASTFWVRARVTGIYGTAPVITQCTVDTRKRYTFSSSDITDASSSSATRYHTLKSGLIYPIFSGSELINALPVKADATKEAHLFHLIRTINFQSALYEWDIFGLALEDQTRPFFSSTRPGLVSQGSHWGSSATLKMHSFVRSGKVDLSSKFYFATTGLSNTTGHAPYQVTDDTAGMVEVDSLGTTAEADGEVTFTAVTQRQINAITRIANEGFAGRVYGAGSKFRAGPEQRKKIVVSISSAGVASIYTPGYYSDGKNLVALPAGLTKTLDLVPSSGWVIPQYARLVGCTINVDTPFSGGGVATLTSSIGTAADNTFWSAAGVDLMTGGDKSPGAFTGRTRQKVSSTGACVAHQLFLTSTGANLSALTAGQVTIELYYKVQQ